MIIDWKNLFRTIVLLLAILLLVMYFSFNKEIKILKNEINRLEIVEQNYEEEKEYFYQCYKDIELKAERSGK